MWLFHFFNNKYATAEANAGLSAASSNRNQSHKTTVNSQYLATYHRVVNFLLEKYWTDEIVVETDSAIMRCE